jgi:hypothetical protein
VRAERPHFAARLLARRFAARGECCIVEARLFRVINDLLERDSLLEPDEAFEVVKRRRYSPKGVDAWFAKVVRRAEVLVSPS